MEAKHRKLTPAASKHCEPCDSPLESMGDFAPGLGRCAPATKVSSIPASPGGKAKPAAALPSLAGSQAAELGGATASAPGTRKGLKMIKGRNGLWGGEERSVRRPGACLGRLGLEQDEADSGVAM